MVGHVELNEMESVTPSHTNSCTHACTETHTHILTYISLSAHLL